MRSFRAPRPLMRSTTLTQPVLGLRLSRSRFCDCAATQTCQLAPHDTVRRWKTYMRYFGAPGRVPAARGEVRVDSVPTACPRPSCDFRETLGRRGAPLAHTKCRGTVRYRNLPCARFGRPWSAGEVFECRSSLESFPPPPVRSFSSPDAILGPCTVLVGQHGMRVDLDVYGAHFRLETKCSSWSHAQVPPFPVDPPPL